MCGIVGIAGTRQPVNPRIVTTMRDHLAHRGPDDEGLAFSRDGTTAFGHRRLAIIDPGPTGHQPMTNPARTLLLTYNGEVYNFRALRAQLEEHGVQFTTGSDAEVVLRAFEHHGPPAVDLLRGMFAYAIWNEESRTCVLTRDRLGIKPLYYALVDGVLYFASEATALLAVPPFTRELDPAALGDYLAYGYVPSPRSIWRRIAKLPPGHQLFFRDGEVRIERYWSPPASTTGTDDEDEIGALLAEAVELHLVSDVPVGAFLSGGLDSSTVTALMARSSSQPIQTYSIDFRGTTRSEVHYARLLAERYATRHRERQLEVGTSIDDLGAVVGAYDEPLADESTLPTYAIAAEVGRHVKVVLSGDGGDEIFAGYAWYEKAARLEGAHRRLGPLANPLARLGRQLTGVLEQHEAGWRLAHRLSLLGGATLDNYFHLTGYLDAAERDALLPAALTRQMETDPLWHLRRYWQAELPVVRRLQLLDLQTYLPDDILVKVDRAAMQHALEVRVPLLDHRVVEATLALPVEKVFRHGTGKQLLRKVAAELVPEEIRTRPKQGFGLPRAEWERNGWQQAIAARLGNGELGRRGMIEPAALDTLLSSSHGRNPNKIWLLFVLDLWLEQQQVL